MSPTKHSADLYAAVEALLAGGESYAEIAERLDLGSRCAVAGLIYRRRMAADADADDDDIATGLAAVEARLRWEVVSQGGCRWVLGTPGRGVGAGAWRWCGAPLRAAAGPYCAAHARISRQGARP